MAGAESSNEFQLYETPDDEDNVQSTFRSVQEEPEIQLEIPGGNSFTFEVWTQPSPLSA